MSNVLAVPVDYVPIHATSSFFSSVRQRRLPSEGDWQHNEFSFEPFVKRELAIRMDTDDEVCPRYARGHCDLQSRCPLRHMVTPSPAVPTLTREDMRRTVCKHWLRGLCKKGDACDYLHEYDLRRMAECRFYATYGFCSAGDECLYVHIEPSVKLYECEAYQRGFCPAGPACPRKHAQRIACPYYLAGFCPQGPECAMGQYVHLLTSIQTTKPKEDPEASAPLLTHRPLPIMEAFGTGPGVHDLPIDPYTGRAIVADEYWGAAEELRKTPAVNAPRDPRRRELSEVQCYKCGERGHFANACPHQGRTNHRGMIDRVGGAGGPGRWR